MKTHTAPFFLILLFMLAHIYCVAQSNIHGKIFNSKNEPAVNASVPLLQANDSSLIKAMICTNTGAYSFNNIKDGNYLIAINLLGYKQAYSTVFVANKSHNDIVIENIMLAEETAQLNDVTVTIKKLCLNKKLTA